MAVKTEKEKLAEVRRGGGLVHSGSALVSVSQVMGWGPCRYITSHPGQLSLAICSWVC